ncbi:MAG: dehydrogenase/GMP reductase [Bacillota bacterium]|jgi:IMP dehydrogenase|nr:dehydrogenase/GMP reductase [Bacillota bacterium]
MAKIISEPSRTFGEYLLLPNLTTKDCVVENVNLTTPLVRFKKGEEPELKLNIPFTSAIMQSVSDHNMAIALAKNGGISFIYGSQSIEAEAEMVSRVKKYKAGFVISDSNLKPDNTLEDVIKLKEKTGHSTIAITEDGTSSGKLVGIVTSRDYRLTRDPLTKKVCEFMTKDENLIVGKEGITLSEANDLIWQNKLNAIPIVDDNFNLVYMVFRKDYSDDKENPRSLLDAQKRYIVGAGINSRDYKERVPALVEAGVDIVCIDSSEGFSEWQYETIKWIKDTYNGRVKVGAGNVVEREGFRYLADAGADFIKVGIGGGSICITREQKGIGRGQASSVLEVSAARDEYFEETGIYVPICSDGGIVHDYHITLALAMGADFVMLGRYFAGFDESPTSKVKYGNGFVKEYWGEGSNRARNWARYDLGGKSELQFEEGVDSYVPYAGKLDDGLGTTLYKIKSTMCNCGAKSIKELQENGRLSIASAVSISEGSAHDVILKNQ